MAQIVAGRGLTVAAVAIDPAPFRGVLPLPISALRSAFPVLGNPLNRGKAVTLTFDQFRYGWANALDEAEARELYDSYRSPRRASRSSRRRWRTSTRDRDQGRHEEPRPRAAADLLRREGPHGAACDRARVLQAAAAQPRRDRAHRDAQPRPRADIDSGWREVAETALEFVKRSHIARAVPAPG